MKRLSWLVGVVSLVACGHTPPIETATPAPPPPPPPNPKTFPAMTVSLAEPPPPSPLVGLLLWSVIAHHPGETVSLMRLECTRETSQHVSGQRCDAGAWSSAFPELPTARARACVNVQEVALPDALRKWFDAGGRDPAPSVADLPPHPVLLTHVWTATRPETFAAKGCRNKLDGQACDPVGYYAFSGPPSEPTPLAASIWIDRQWRSLDVDTKGNTRPDDLASLLFPQSWVLWDVATLPAGAADPRFLWDRSSTAPVKEQAEAMRKRLAAIDASAEGLPIQAAVAVADAYLALLFDERDHVAQSKTRLDALVQRLLAELGGRIDCMNCPLWPAYRCVSNMATAVGAVLRGTHVMRDPCPPPAGSVKDRASSFQR